MIPLFKVHVPEEVDAPLLEVLHSGYITQGVKVDEFEKKFGEIMGFDNVASVNSGTSALTLALRLAGVGAGDEVITTAMTCTATNLPILSLGGVPVFADVDPHTGLIRPADIEGRIRPNTKAIMAVDWGGLPVDVKALMDIAKRYNLKVIVDAAHALGTRHNEQPDFLCYSLQAIKHITTGDGGVLVSKSAEDHHRATVLRWFGIDRSKNGLDSRIDQDIEEWGYKFHMNDLNATIGIVQLDHIARVVKAHQTNAAYLFNEITDREFYEHPPFEGTFWLYTLLLPSQELRDKFKSFMEEQGIQVSQVHKRNDEYTVFKPFATRYEGSAGMDVPQSYAGLDRFASRMICVPVHWALTFEDLHKITQACNTFAEQNR